MDTLQKEMKIEAIEMLVLYVDYLKNEGVIFNSVTMEMYNDACTEFEKLGFSKLSTSEKEDHLYFFNTYMLKNILEKYI